MLLQHCCPNFGHEGQSGCQQDSDKAAKQVEHLKSVSHHVVPTLPPPYAPADGCVDSALQAQLVQCCESEAASTDPELMAAVVQLARSALRHHPSLVDVLCFPTRLTPAAPEGKVGPYAQCFAVWTLQ